MLRDAFALFQPGLWQEEGLVTVAVTEEERTPPATVVRKMEKWAAATTAIVALSAALIGTSPAHTSFTTGSAGATRRFVIATEEGTAGAMIQGAEVPAGYWSDLAREVATWPRLSVGGDFDDGPEPLA